MSPYLFVLAIEGLSLLLEEVAASPLFNYHPKCKTVKLNHLFFADDLLIFSAANCNLVLAIIGVLDESENLSSLKANPSKSSIFLAGVSLEDKQDILALLQTSERTLPVRYLGVPLITKRLTASDCENLVAWITTRIESWLVRNLSFAGRLQLLSSVLLSLQVYWKVFILPNKIIKLIEQKFNRFLLGGWGLRNSKAHAKVVWDKLCAPKQEGGLGIKRIEVWNKTSMLNHIWNIFTKASSLWVAWIELIG